MKFRGKTVLVIDRTDLAPPTFHRLADWRMVPGDTWGSWCYAYCSNYYVITKDGYGPSCSMLMIPDTYWEDVEYRTPAEALEILRSLPGALTKK